MPIVKEIMVLLLSSVVVLINVRVSSDFVSDDVEEVTTENGTSAIFQCPFHEDATDKRLLVWLFNTTIISTDRESYIEKVMPFMTPDGVQGLEIMEVSPKHEGRYCCELPGSFTKFFNLVVTYPPQIVRHSPNLSKVLTREGSSFTMECTATGKPDPTMTWYKKDPPNGHNVTVSFNGTVMTLENLTKNDRGSYVCEATNGVGHPARHTFTIHIAYRPIILHTSDDIHIGIGLNVSIQCVVNSNPVPQVTWHKVEDHNTLLDHVITHEGELDGGHTVSSRLSFWRVQRSDEGEYICRGQNDLDVTEKRVRLRGSPHDLVITSRIMGEHSHTYHVSWQVVSLSKLERLEITLEQIPDDTSIHYPQEFDTVEYPVPLDGLIQNGVVYAPARNRTIRDLVGSRNYYVIEDLFPDTEYELRLRVSNAFGFSPWTRGFRFRTAEVVQNDEHLDPSSTYLIPTIGKQAGIRKEDYDMYSGAKVLAADLMSISSIYLLFTMIRSSVA